MAVSNSPEDQARLEVEVGHPNDKFVALVAQIQQGAKTFRRIEHEFLDLIWTLDAYRVAQVVPREMGKADLTPSKRLDGIYRSKGNYFSTVVTEIIKQKTSTVLEPRSNVQGFSQVHQIDIAWPARDRKPIVDPLICCEAKLTGAPPYPGNPGRGATDDWSNRRKELKFQATDLKLYRQATNTQIRNWDRWRKQAPPSVYSIWAARVDKDPKISQRAISKMVSEARILTATYSDGVGIYAFQENAAGTGYEPSQVSRGVDERVTSLDGLLDYIAAHIQDVMAENNNAVPPPVLSEALGIGDGE